VSLVIVGRNHGWYTIYIRDRRRRGGFVFIVKRDHGCFKLMIKSDDGLIFIVKRDHGCFILMIKSG